VGVMVMEVKSPPLNKVGLVVIYYGVVELGSFSSF